ncbi:uncharacterized protein [Rutidosis leptorrhynchoides]|uniref:uncharacterized protein n=1 Tax=Rutidosis leptorrhynchoides TaxID=125765 RepID=UPI003A99749F
MASGADSSSSSMVPDQENNEPLATGLSYQEADGAVEVSPTILQSIKRPYVCNICSKGYVRVQNLIFHLKVHNLHYPIKSTYPGVTKRVYLCPVTTCNRHKREFALCDFGGLRKHYLRKHSTEKKYKCNKCSKEYAVKIDFKAHLKVCGVKRYVSDCGAWCSSLYDVNVHQESYVEQEHASAAQDPPALNIGNSSINATFNNNTLICLNASDLTHNFAFQNPSAYYPSFAPYHQSQFYTSGADNWSPVTDPFTGLNLETVIPDYSFTSTTQQNQHELQEGSNFGLYANQLIDRVSLNDAEGDFESFMSDGGNIYGNGNGSNLDSSSVMLTPDVHNVSVIEMLNPVSGVGPSTFNQRFGPTNDQGGYYFHGDEGGKFDHGGGMETVKLETSTEATKVLAPYEQHLNQFRGFWF